MTAPQILTARDVPLGGVRAITVRRTLPHRERSRIGAWCFVDHYGPHDVTTGHGMDVAPHPHTGLQTLSWLFDGMIEHRDSGGVLATVRPGEANLMTAGRGVCHSEVTMPETTVLHGVQLWIALPDHARNTTRAFEHHVSSAVRLPDDAGTARVFAGSLAGVGSSPITLHTPLVGAQLDLVPYGTVSLELDETFEYGILLDRGAVSLGDTSLGHGDLACFDPGQHSLELAAGAEGARVVLLGGAPFDEPIIMWWNFVGRTHDEIVAHREAWQNESTRFGRVDGYVGTPQRLLAPPMPEVRLRPRT